MRWVRRARTWRLAVVVGGGQAVLRSLLRWALRRRLVLPRPPVLVAGVLPRSCPRAGGASGSSQGTDPARGPPSGYALVA